MKKLAGLILLVAACRSTPAETRAEGQDVVNDSATAVSTIKDKERHLATDLASAKAVVILPRVTRAGLGVGYSGGRGVMLTRNEQGNWSQPSFCAVNGPMAGLLAGGSRSQVVLVFMTKSAVDKALDGKLSFGANATVASGPEKGGRAGTASKDIYAYAMGKGTILNVSLDGLVLTTKDEWNRDYYGSDLTQYDILVGWKGEHEGTKALREALKK